MTGADVAVGVDLGGTKIDLCAVTPGEAERSSRIATDAAEGAGQVIARICAEAVRLAEGRTIGAVALAVPGVVSENGIRRAPHVPGLEQLSLADEFRMHLPQARLRVLNDLNAAARGFAGDDQRSESMLTVGLGTGVAAGMLLRGRVFEGATQAAGEIGDALVPAPDGHGLVGLETVVGGRAFDVLAEENGFSGARELLDAVSGPRGPVGLRSEVLRRLDLLAGALSVTMTLTDASRVVLFGGFAAHALVRERVESALVPQSDGAHRLRWSGDDERPVLRGAVHAALDELDAVPEVIG